MNHLERLHYCLTFGSEIGLCVFVFTRRVERILPCFAAYIAVLTASTLGLMLAYESFGFRSATSYYFYWTTELVSMIARSLAIIELCRCGLRAYRGIWTLVGTVLFILAPLFLAHATADAWGQPDRLAIYGLTLERDVDISSIIVLIVLLLIRKYYGITLESLQRTIAFGICFFCIADLLNNTILRNLYTGDLFFWFSTNHMSLWPALRAQIERVSDLYGTIRVTTFMISVGIWCYALRKPLPALEKAPELLPAEVYGALSPAVNLRLRAFNDRLLEMLKP
jgi:hypothetical protein